MAQQLVLPRLQLAEIGTAPAGARVRHFDELDEHTQEFVSHSVAGRRCSPRKADLEPGDVVVYTGYFSVLAA